MIDLEQVLVKPEVLDVVVWENPVLTTVCEKIEDNEFGPKLESFGRQLIATMDTKNGVGLAAPQVGVLKRMFVLHFPDNEDFGPKVICNPTLELNGATTYHQEGCLSLPGVFEVVARAEKVTMQYRDPLGKQYEMLIDKMDARVTQHEFDHLNGILFFNYTDKRPVYGARMSRQDSRNVMRTWEKKKRNL